MTSLYNPPTNRACAGHNERHFPDAKVQTFGEGNAGKTIEHYVKAPFMYSANQVLIFGLTQNDSFDHVKIINTKFSVKY